MTTQLSPVTVCGLIAQPSVEPYAWKTALYQHDVSSLEVDFPVSLSANEVRTEAAELCITDAHFLGAVVHPGHVERCRRIDYADVAVVSDDEVSAHPGKNPYTVCGIYLDNGETYCATWVSHGPLMAYYDTWLEARNDGRTFLVACVHEGEIGRIDGLQLADPSCATEDVMKEFMHELVPTMIS
jgi:hypothetical protein